MACYPNIPQRRAGWLPPGPWDQEEDHESWYQDGYYCVISRSSLHGTLHARVEIPKGHPLFELSPEEINRKLIVIPHRGVSVAVLLYGKWSAELRFGHPGDLVPINSSLGGEYRSFEYVKAALLEFVSQIKGMVA